MFFGGSFFKKIWSTGVAVDAGICIGVEVDVAIGLGAGAGIPVVIGIGVAVPMTKCENGVDGMLADEFDG